MTLKEMLEQISLPEGKIERLTTVGLRESQRIVQRHQEEVENTQEEIENILNNNLEDMTNDDVKRMIRDLHDLSARLYVAEKKLSAHKKIDKSLR